MHFSHAQDRLVPFMHGYNKVRRAARLLVGVNALPDCASWLASSMRDHHGTLSRNFADILLLVVCCRAPLDCAQVWFATASHVQHYRDLVAGDPETFTCKGHHDSRRTVAGHVLCYTGPFK